MTIRDRKGRRPRRGEVDWEDLRRRLARATAATEGTPALTPEQAASVLGERARQLARVKDGGIKGEVLQVVVMAVGVERYAVEARWVRHALRTPELTAVPGTAPPFAGLIAVRGEALPVFYASHLLGAGGEPARAGTVLVLGEAAPDVGLLVDEATEVEELSERSLTAPPASLSEAARALVRGVTAEGLALLAGDALLSDRRLFVIGTSDAA